MTHDADIQDDDQPDAASAAAGVFACGLWADARWHVEQLEAVFPASEDFVTSGLKRSVGQRFAAWLYVVEATVRRLILAAAQALGLAPIARTLRAIARTTNRPARPASRTARFRVFAFHHAGRPRAHDPNHAAHFGDMPFRHAALPRDPLLNIGRPERDITRNTRRNTPWTQRTATRRVIDRPSRFDPDHHWPEPEDSDARYRRLVEERARRAGRTPRPACERAVIHVSADRVRERELREETRLIPAPGLVRRLAALVQLMRDPMDAITRTARRLARKAGLLAALASQPDPCTQLAKLSWLRRQPPGQDMLLEAYFGFGPGMDSS